MESTSAGEIAERKESTPEISREKEESTPEPKIVERKESSPAPKIVERERKAVGNRRERESSLFSFFSLLKEERERKDGHFFF